MILYFFCCRVRVKIKDECSPRIEPGTFCAVGGSDNHYTTKSWMSNVKKFNSIMIVKETLF